jgi:hypothetical protein
LISAGSLIAIWNVDICYSDAKEGGSPQWVTA